MRAVAVFCGSSLGNDPAPSDVAAALGNALARRGLRLVFGGGHVGLMGVLADAALAAGGAVTGVMPRSLVEREVAHTGLTELIVTETMHERKATMERLTDGFVALPGGIGTLDELCEIVTWALLGIHAKPIGLLDANGFHDPLRAVFDGAVATGFLSAEHRRIVLDGTDPDTLLDAMAAWHPTAQVTWTRPGVPGRDDI